MRRARILFRVVLVAAIVVFGALLLLRAFATAPEEAQQPEPPVFTDFAWESSASCADAGASEIAVTLTWAATDAEEAWIGVDTEDASADPAGVVEAATGSATILVPCPAVDSLWTVTVQGEAGVAHESVRIVPGEAVSGMEGHVLFVGAPVTSEEES